MGECGGQQVDHEYQARNGMNAVCPRKPPSRIMLGYNSMLRQSTSILCRKDCAILLLRIYYMFMSHLLVLWRGSGALAYE
jgi:hypothetical protein